MRIGIFLPKAFRPYSIDFDGYALEMAATGHEPVIICPRNEHPDFPLPVEIYGDGDASRTEFWMRLKLDRVITMTWFRHADIYHAIRAAGIRIINRVDSDGLVSTRVFPGSTWLRLVDPFRGPVDFLRRFRHFLNWYFIHSKAHDADIIGILELSDRVVVETKPFLENFEKFLRFHHRVDLLDRFSIIPHSVPDIFLSASLPSQRRNRIFCSGRWDDDQKDAPLLAAAIPLILKDEPEAEFLIAGYGVHEAFSELAANDPQVRLLGLMNRSELPNILSGCRFLLSSSRWESHPIGALEALCCGCTVAATPVPGFADIAKGDKYGTLSRGHSAQMLAKAAKFEMRLWGRGKRNPVEIASHWRAEVSNKTVVARLLSL